MEIEFEGQYDKEQYLRAVKTVITPSKRSTIVRILVFVAAAVAITLLYVIGMRDGELNEIENNRVRLALFAGLLLSISLATPYFGIRSTTERLWNKPSVQRLKAGRVTAEGITYGDKLKPWSSYIRKYVFEDMILLLTTDEGMSLLPRSFFRDERDWKQFSQMVEQYAVNAKNRIVE